MFHLLLFLLALLAPTVASAAVPVVAANREYPLGTLLSGVALNASSASRTFSLDDDREFGFNLLVAYVYLTRSAATDVRMTCTGAPDAESGPAVLQDITVASGVGTSDDARFQKAVSGTAAWPWRVDVTGYRNVKCTLSGTSGGSSDLVTVKGYLTKS
jgi:hypothetical protein